MFFFVIFRGKVLIFICHVGDNDDTRYTFKKREKPTKGKDKARWKSNLEKRQAKRKQMGKAALKCQRSTDEDTEEEELSE